MEKIIIKKNIVDKAIEFIAPQLAANRMKARYAMAIAGAYTGAKLKRSMSSFNPRLGDADADSLGDLKELRKRSSDLVRNAPIATGAVGTNVTHVVGSGLKMRSRIDRKALGMNEQQAKEWQDIAEREFSGWANGLDCDISRQSNFFDLQQLVFRGMLERGDDFILMPFKEVTSSPYRLRLQVIESDRISNNNNQMDTERLTAGVEKDQFGAPTHYWIKTVHPGDTKSRKRIDKWERVPAFTQSGRRNVIHLSHQLRPGQTRGIPYLAPVIEQLYQLAKYTETELTAAVVSSLFTVFLKTPRGTGFSTFKPETATGGNNEDDSYNMGAGSIVQMASNEDVEFANPTRPNTSFDPFVQAILRQIGVALGIPFELLIMHFTKSYSAARSAMMMAWKIFSAKRDFLVNHFCNLVYEAWMEEAVLINRIIAPGFDDPTIRQAYLKNIWIGPSQGSIDPSREMDGVEKRIDLGLTTLSEETASLTGSDWDQKIDTMRREKKIMQEINGAQESPADKKDKDEVSEEELENGDDEE